MSTTTTTTIADLPDLCLLTIFDHCLLMELPSSVFLTCTRWAQLRSSIYARRRSIQITVIERDDSDKGPYVCGRSELFCGTTLTTAQLDWLVRSFSNINKLDIFYGNTENNHSVVDWVISLLTQWANKLESFTHYQTIANNDDAIQLLRSVNSLTKLQHLNIELLQCPMRKRVPFLNNVLFTILSQLKTFNFSSDYKMVDFCSWVSKHYQGNTELKIGFEDPSYRKCSQEQLETVYRIAGPFLHQFCGMDFGFQPNFEQFHQFCHHFRELSSVQLYLFSLSFKQITQCLAQLSNPCILSVYPCKNHELFTDCSEPGEFMPLPKVDALYLHLFGNLIDMELFKRIPYLLIFPNLKTVWIYLYNSGSKFDQAIPYARILKDCPHVEYVDVSDSDGWHTLTEEQLQ